MVNTEDLAQITLRKLQEHIDPMLAYLSDRGVALTRADSMRAQRLLEESPRRVIGVYDELASLEMLAEDIEYAKR